MSKLQVFQKGLQNSELTSKEQNSIKGGGWGSGTSSKGKGCPPPAIMADFELTM